MSTLATPERRSRNKVSSEGARYRFLIEAVVHPERCAYERYGVGSKFIKRTNRKSSLRACVEDDLQFDVGK